MERGLIGRFRGFGASSNPPFIKTMAIINIYDCAFHPTGLYKLLPQDSRRALTKCLPLGPETRLHSQLRSAPLCNQEDTKRAAEAWQLTPQYPKSESETGNPWVHTAPGAGGAEAGICFRGRLFVLFLFDGFWRPANYSPRASASIFFFFLSSFVCFETGSSYVAQASLELSILQQPPAELQVHATTPGSQPNLIFCPLPSSATMYD